MPLIPKQEPPYYETTNGTTSGGYYTALLTQSGTSAPTTTELINTLQLPNWTRTSAGLYKITKTTAFTQDKTYFTPFGDFGGDANTYLPLWAGTGAILGYWTMYAESEDTIAIQVKATDGTPTDLSSIIGTTKLMLPTIIVYP